MTETRITRDAAEFVAALRYEDIPEDALKIARRCILDGLGQFAAGADTRPVRIVAEDAADQGGREQARLLGEPDHRVPAVLAARVLGTAGHALDWDDTQATQDPRHTYGLLTHPTVPPLAAGLALSEAMGPVSGRDFMTAFQAGFEVECKIAEWMLPDAYRRGLHASAAVGTIGAAATAAKLMKLDAEATYRALGISASLSSAGIRGNVGTETKPLHFGRAAENGLISAQLAARGLECGDAPLDKPFGFLGVFSGGWFEEKLAEGFGKTFSIVAPGVSVKPYPSGILSHQAMDAMLALVERADLKPEAVERIDFFAGSNILKPLGFTLAKDHLEAKFCMPALLSMIVLNRRAGKQEFTDEFVASEGMQEMQGRCRVILDEEIEAQGFDKIRSRIEVHTRDGQKLVERASEVYRGSPENPITDADLEQKLRDATEGILDRAEQDKLIAAAWEIDLEATKDAGHIGGLLPKVSQTA